MNAYYRKQSAVTIVEVLFAIGIVIIGLMGIGGLIMISGTQLTQGLKADAMSNLGLNAVEEFDMRYMRKKEQVAWYNPDNSQFDLFLGDDSYCIDPYYIAQQIEDNNNVAQFTSFPGGLAASSANPNMAVMPRVTLINASGIVNDPTLYDPSTYGANVSRIMNKLQAQELFTSKDNLAMRWSDAATELPKQVWFDDRPSPLADSMRINDGIDNDYDGVIDEEDEAYVKRIGFGDLSRLGSNEFSWMATITPDRTFMVSEDLSRRRPDRTDQFLISLVIFHNRVLKQNTTTLEDQERVLLVTLRGNGFGGGEVRLQSDNPADLDLKHGDWVMLSAASEVGDQFRWYKVTYIDDEVQQLPSNAFYRDATLQGPDWNRRQWLDPTHPAPKPTYATFIPHVIGVFEKTIRIETTSLY